MDWRAKAPAAGSIIANVATISGATNNGTLTVAGASTWNNGTNNGTLVTGNGSLTITGSLTNGGTVSNAGGQTVSNTGTINGGTLVGTITNGNGTTISGTVSGVTVAANSQAVNPGGTVDATNYTQNSGSALVLNGTLMVSVANLLEGSTVTGTGSFGTNNISTTNTTVNNQITLDVAGASNVGTWNLARYTQSSDGTLVFDIDGPSVGQYDQLDVRGNVSLAGDLSLAGTYNYASNHAAIYDLIHFTGTETGAFSDVSLATGWKLVYDPSDVYLEYNEGTVPEPAPYWLIGGGVTALGLIRRRRRIAA